MQQELPSVTESQNIHFVDETSDWQQGVDTVLDETYTIASTPDIPLGEYLSRPVEIAHFAWSANSASPSSFPGLNKAAIINPWKLFFETTEMKNRIDTYAMLRCKLKVKFLVNGNGFMYGNMIVYYHPLVEYDDFSVYGPKTSYPVPHSDLKYVTMYQSDITRHSQKPHIFLIPSQSQGGTLELPFVWPRSYVNITNGEIEKLGEIFIFPLNTLKTITTSSTVKADVSVMAWAENVELALPTTQPAAIVPPTPSAERGIAISHAGNDEYGSGPVAKCANAVASSAYSLRNEPVIGPYARATSMIGGTIGAIASAFGFSRPSIIKDITPYKPLYLGNMCNTDAGDTSNKLSLDSKQEVTIDPRVVGLSDKDEMTIRSIAGRESFFQQVPWSSSKSYGARLMQLAVCPQVYRSVSQDGTVYNNNLDFPGCCYAAIPFNSWRGTMRYRFQIIASQFHRGRLRIVWDPRMIAEDSAGVLLTTTKIYSKIVDLAESRDFVVDVGWGQATPFISCDVTPGVTPLTELYASSVTDPIAKSNGKNGVLGVYVLNPLITTTVSASEVNDITFNVYVSCPDLEVANPMDDNMQRYTFKGFGSLQLPTTEMAVSHGGFVEDDNSDDHAPVATGVNVLTLGPPISTLTDRVSEVFFGDPIVSLRTLMKRYTFYVQWPTLPAGGATDDKLLPYCTNYTLPDFPYYQGHTDSFKIMNVKTAASAAQAGWNPVQCSYMSFYTPAYVCRRGAIRWKYCCQPNVISAGSQVSSSTEGLNTLRVARGINATSRSIVTQVPVNQKPTSQMFFTYNWLPSGAGGQYVTATNNNPTVEVELPFYNQNRFAIGFSRSLDKATDSATRTAEDLNNFPHHKVSLTSTRCVDSNLNIGSFVAAGDDFSLFFYIGPPPVYYAGALKKVLEPVSADAPFPS